MLVKTTIDALYNHIICQHLDNSSCELKCKERENKANTLFLFKYAMKFQNLIGHVSARCIFVVVLTNYMDD